MFKSFIYIFINYTIILKFIGFKLHSHYKYNYIYNGCIYNDFTLYPIIIAYRFTDLFLFEYGHTLIQIPQTEPRPMFLKF